MPRVRFTSDAAIDFQRLPTILKARVRDVIARLELWPNVSGAKPLRHALKGSYRIRTGDYRIVFSVKSDLLTVTRIDNRREVYGRK
jgi:mRNA-degrading endonuclease RelE of RelBE toxin-antitoxin system